MNLTDFSGDVGFQTHQILLCSVDSSEKLFMHVQSFIKYIQIAAIMHEGRWCIVAFI